MHDRLSGSWCRAVYSVVGKGRKRRDGIESKGRDITRFKYSRRHEVGGGRELFLPNNEVLRVDLNLIY